MNTVLEQKDKLEKKLAPWREFEKKVHAELKKLNDDWKVQDHSIRQYTILKTTDIDLTEDIEEGSKTDENTRSQIIMEKRVVIPDFIVSHTRTYTYVFDAKFYKKASITKNEVKQVEEYRKLSKSSGAALIMLPQTKISKSGYDLARMLNIGFFRFDNDLSMLIEDWLKRRVKCRENRNKITQLKDLIKKKHEAILAQSEKLTADPQKEKYWKANITRIKNSISETTIKVKRVEEEQDYILKIDITYNYNEYKKVQSIKK